MVYETKKKDISYLEALSEQEINITISDNNIVSDKRIHEESKRDLELTDNSLHKFYNFPKYYDKAFTRDVKSDISFFKKCFQEYSDIEVKRVLEPACGPGMFLEALPKYGFYALGYDINPSMVKYAKEKLDRAGLASNRVDVLEGNMINKKFDENFDAAFICINSLGYLRNEEDIISHFRVLADCLKTGGIYIVEISCKCDDIRNEKKFDDTWYVREENFYLELTWAINWYNIEQRIRHVDFRMVINDNGFKTEVEEAHELRLWIFDEFKQFATFGGFEIQGIYNQKYERISENIPITGELGALFFILKKIS
ncbi:MAG: class I SAM-dependent methyltransferase [Candidatus Thorarchaeota archaeon]